ncbi:hypothetical protein SPRA44_50001 [Serratia proteamaculans]|nr:hypothetical protein SPRA44_50001 [Serratia proteamaculans]
MGSPHARVGHCQASNKVESLMRKHEAFYCVQKKEQAQLHRVLRDNATPQ